ncbi:MAG: hypothetical protein LBU32_12430 [Clostridiales bacterium]|nr:hypothetical protein [Clostridiales bacterium]
MQHSPSQALPKEAAIIRKILLNTSPLRYAAFPALACALLILASCEGNAYPGGSSHSISSTLDAAANAPNALAAEKPLGDQPKNPQALQESESSLRWISASDELDLSGMNIFSQKIVPFADDEASVTAYTAAEKSQDGTFMFDDGQDWALVIETADGAYPLFPRQYVQLGGVFATYYLDIGAEETIPHVLVNLMTSSVIYIYDCAYDADAKAFSVLDVFKTDNASVFGRFS